MAASDCALYRPRVPQAMPLNRLVQAHYADVRDAWEERYERQYGFWRAFTDTAVGACLECGILENGFARVRCGACRAEFPVAFSCKGRGLCPSCAAKRAAALAAFLREEVLADVGHAQWVLSIPKMLRPYFLYHRPLLGRLCQAAYHTAREMISAAAPGKGSRSATTWDGTHMFTRSSPAAAGTRPGTGCRSPTSMARPLLSCSAIVSFPSCVPKACCTQSVFACSCRGATRASLSTPR